MSPPANYVRRVFGQLSYRLSPMELNAVKGCLSPGFTNTCRRIGEEIPYVVPRKCVHIQMCVDVAFKLHPT